MKFRATVYLGPDSGEAKTIYKGLKEREGKPYTFIDKTVFPHEPVTGLLVEVTKSHHEKSIHRGQTKDWSSVTVVVELDFTKPDERFIAKRILGDISIGKFGHRRNNCKMDINSVQKTDLEGRQITMKCKLSECKHVKKATTAVSKMAGRTGLKMKKHSPEILMATGIVGVVGATVLACKATLRADEVLDRHEDKMQKIRHANPEEYNEQDMKKDTTIVYVQTAVDFAKLYAPAVTIGTLSIACILGSHNIMKKRNVAVMAAYKTLDAAFGDYRKRVVDQYGEDVDHNLKYGVTKEKVEVIERDENGKSKKKKETIEVVDPNKHSQYARFFDESSPNWTKTPEYNMMFLQGQQNYANDMLKSRGHLFLNEVYDSLGIPRTQAGAVVGWVLGEGDDFVDFGIFDVNSTVKRDFVNGYERSILLDFNVDGVIWDLI